MGLYIVAGDPVTHSLSPVMHNAAFKALGMHNHRYGAARVTPHEAYVLIDAIRRGKVAGANVTYPLKTVMHTLADKLTGRAQASGSVNTLWAEGRNIVGDSTDGEGCICALREECMDVSQSSILLIGAGGAARSIALSLFEHGARDVSILNRNEKKAAALCKSVGAYGHGPLRDLKRAIREKDILINATTIGMKGHPRTLGVTEDDLDPSMLVMDIVYDPLETPLLQAASAAGCRTIRGTKMLVWQGALSFERWFGKKAPVNVMEDAILRTIGG